jgi:PilZ domain-containing protein
MADEGTRMAAETGAGQQKERRFRRFSVDMRVQAQVFRAGTLSTAWGRSWEMGEDGMSGTLTGEMEPGDVVSLEFTLPHSREPMKVRAVVRHRTGYRYGFEFLTVTDAQREQMREAFHQME